MDRYTEGLRDAAYAYGVKRLAYELDMSETRLYKKLDPDGAISLTLADFFRINRKLQDVQVVQPLLNDLDLVATRKAARDDDATLFDLVINHQVAAGTVAQTVRDALADNRISAQERKEIRKAVRAEIDALTSLEAELEEMAEPRLAKA
ncbi:phage regulatory CII family protein [Halomonas denitrificans]|uniref:phage regulatory CII family protein n=1 Tax=Halomonas TaxID=2745 RepID=UPI001CD1B135|nr:phage regulatory CII family protein [Halomonas denitrificans]MCA0973435.1 phage regulatory CII family protein [Halomonas denitrificans]